MGVSMIGNESVDEGRGRKKRGGLNGWAIRWDDDGVEGIWILSICMIMLYPSLSIQACSIGYRMRYQLWKKRTPIQNRVIDNQDGRCSYNRVPGCRDP